MKNLIGLFIICMAAFAFTPANTTSDLSTEISIEEVGGKLTILNDTSSKVSIHTGYGFVSLNRGSKTSVTCKPGKEVRLAKSGSKKDLLFEVDSDMCGETVRLSDYM